MGLLATLCAETGDTAEATAAYLSSASTTQKRTGTYSIYCDVNGSVQIPLVSPGSEIILRCWVYLPASVSTTVNVIRVRNGTTTLAAVSINSTPECYVTIIGGDTNVLVGTCNTSAWNRIDLRYKAGTGANAEAECWLNGGGGVLASNGTATADADNVRFYSPSSVNSYYYDDCVVYTGATLPATDSVGMVRPNATGDDTTWTVVGGDTYVWEAWSDVGPDDATYAYSGGIASHLCNLTTITLGTLGGVRFIARLRDESAYVGPAYLQSKVPAQSLEQSSDLEPSLTTAFAWYRWTPSTQPSSQSDLDGLQAGADSDYASKNLFCSELAIAVDYAAGGASYEITGAVTVAVAVASTLDYTLNASITGAVAVPVAIASAMDYTLNASVVGAIAVEPAVAAGLDYTLTRSLSGDVTVPLGISASLDYTLTRAIIGSVTVSIAVAAAIDYTLNASLTGAIAVPATVAAGLDYTLTRAITGAVPVALTIASAMTYEAGTAVYNINGSVSLTVAIAAAMAQASNWTMAGAITVPIAIAGTFLYATDQLPVRSAASIISGPFADIMVSERPASSAVQSPSAGSRVN